jgi:hypothetical protein
LKPLQRTGRLSIWDDTKIEVGKHWGDEIENALDSAQVAILLVSPNFMASDFINQVELPKMLMKATLDGLVIKPLIISRSSLNEIRIYRRYRLSITMNILWV